MILSARQISLEADFVPERCGEADSVGQAVTVGVRVFNQWSIPLLPTSIVCFPPRTFPSFPDGLLTLEMGDRNYD